MRSSIRLLFAAAPLFLVLAASNNAAASEYFFPQVVDGRNSSLGYFTSFLMNNVLDTRNTITITFFQNNGAPWVLQLQSSDRSDVAGRDSTFTFVVDGRETINLSTIGTEPIAAGWARIKSTLPLNVSEVFSAIKPGAPLQAVSWEAGVLANPTSSQFSFEAAYSAGETVEGTTVNTGYAIANPNGGSVTVTATLFSRTGNQMGQKTFTLGSNAQVAEFFTQRFSDVALPPKFHGLLRLSSSSNVALCALRSSAGSSTDVYSTVAVNPDFSLGYNIYSDREPNNSLAGAQQILLPAEIVGSKNATDFEADADYFAVNLQAGQTLYFLGVADMIGSLYDGDIYIYNFDSALNQLAYAVNWAAGLKDPGLSYQVKSSGLYYVAIGSRTGANTSGSSYRLFIMAR